MYRLLVIRFPDSRLSSHSQSQADYSQHLDSFRFPRHYLAIISALLSRCLATCCSLRLSTLKRLLDVGHCRLNICVLVDRFGQILHFLTLQPRKSKSHEARIFTALDISLDLVGGDFDWGPRQRQSSLAFLFHFLAGCDWGNVNPTQILCRKHIGRAGSSEHPFVPGMHL